MLITCPRCQTVFQFPDEMLPVDIASLKVKCSRCQMVFSPPSDVVQPVDSGGFDSLEVEDIPIENPGSLSDNATLVVSGSEGGEVEMSESLDVGNKSDGFDADDLPIDEPQELPDDNLVDVDENAEMAVGLLDENPRIDKETTGGKDVEDIVFELADDFEEDLSWDIDDDEDQHKETIPEPDKSDGRQTVIDQDGLFDEDGGDKGNLASRPDAENKTIPSDDVSDFQSEAGEEEKSTERMAKGSWQSRRTLLYLFSIFIVLSLAVWGGMLLWQKFSIDMEKHLSIVGLESRNYIFSPDKRVIAIQGKLYNTSPKVIGKLKIKGVIVDRQGNVLAEGYTSGGVTFSEEELQNLDEKTVEKLENPAATVSANGGELPFMLVFYDYPPSASSYHVELVEFSILKKGKKP